MVLYITYTTILNKKYFLVENSKFGGYPLTNPICIDIIFYKINVIVKFVLMNQIHRVD